MKPNKQKETKTGARPKRAFTLTELLVVIATLALLAAVVLPALGATPFGKGGFAAKVASCANIFRQWAIVANLCANDHAGNLPSFPQPPTGFNPTDVSSTFLPGLVPYGLTVPMWFCPVRPWEFAEANREFHASGLRYINNTTDLSHYVTLKYGYFAFLNHDWWVPRQIQGGAYNGQLFPYPPNLGGVPFLSVRTTGPNAPTNGWPRTTSDSTVATQPIITDLMNGLGTTNAATAGPGHPLAQNGQAININRGYADGHVETVPVARIQWQIAGNSYTFY